MDEYLVMMAEDAQDVSEFPIPIERTGMARSTAHGGTRKRHVTCLLLCLLAEEGEVKLLLMNKRERNLLKDPTQQVPALCLDTPGGHFQFADIPAEMARLGLLDLDTALDECLHELNGEVRGGKAFTRADLVPLLNVSYDADPCNRELRVVMGVWLEDPWSVYHMQDDFIDPATGAYRNITLPTLACSYRKLSDILHHAPADMMLHDGLRQLLELPQLPSLIWEKMGRRLII